MRKSNKILISAITVFTVVSLGCNLILKAEYDKIDFDDPYYGYSTEMLDPFKYVVLFGTGHGLTQISPGDGFRIRTTLSKQSLGWRIEGDTLTINLGMNMNENNWAPSELAKAKPVVYISAPVISGVSSTGVSCKISGLKNQGFALRQERSRVLLASNSIQNLTAQSSLLSSIEIDPRNSIDSAAISLNDSSSLIAPDSKFKFFELDADESAHLEIPMTLINQISKK